MSDKAPLDLRDPRQAGVYRVMRADLVPLLALAQDEFVTVHDIDLHGIDDKPALLARIAEALAFPTDWGRNWDALADQLRDLGWLPESRGYILLFTHAASLHANDPASFSTLLSLLADAADHWRTSGVPFQAVFTLPAHMLRVQGNSSEPR